MYQIMPEMTIRAQFWHIRLALIREKTALLFWDIPGSKPIWLSGAFSQRKITANSTYREAKRW